MPYLGAHMPTAGGIEKSFERLASVGGRAMQIFTRNQRQWNAAPLSDDEIDLFAQAWKASDCRHVVSHASYLINPASDDEEIMQKSVNGLARELARCRTLEIPWTVLHPGAHKGQGIDEGIRRVAASLDAAFELSETKGVGILLETTAGQGTTLGSTFAELARIIELSQHGGMLGVCLDTSHVFAAGHDLRTRKAYTETMKRFDGECGIDRLRFFHLNDSKVELGARVDRHEHIGQGFLGLKSFELLLNDPRFAEHPMTLETPKGKNLAGDRMNLATLRKLLKKPGK